MEVYNTLGEVQVDDDDAFDAWSAQDTHQLNNGEKLELIRTRFFEVAEYARTKSPAQQSKILDTWSAGIDKIAGDWCLGSMTEWLGEHISFGDDEQELER